MKPHNGRVADARVNIARGSIIMSKFLLAAYAV